MHVVVGLGNPGTRYAGTRHNVGFDVVDCLARRHGTSPFKRWKGALVSRGPAAGEDVLLAKPTTYMNLSGDAVHALVAYYRVGLDRLVVVHDELDFEPGQFRVKLGGGHGGHNGLRSIMAHLGPDFVRVRLGIGKPSDCADGADYVLGRFGSGAGELVREAVEGAADAVELVLRSGVQAAMGRYNRRNSQGDSSPSTTEL